MTAPNANTFELTPPRRPGTADFNGVSKSDSSTYPPNPQTQPNAAEWNTLEFLVLALGRLMPCAILCVSGGGSPSINTFSCASSKLISSTFTVTLNATGDVSITWAAGTFPSSILKPNAYLNAGPGMIHATPITNGVRIYTYNSSGAAANLDFTVQIF